MRLLGTTLAAFGLACISALPVAAQQLNAEQMLPGETWLEFAKRMDACDGAEVLDAELKMVGGGSNLEVLCSQGAVADATNGMSGGLGAAAAIGGGALLLVFALGGGGSDGPSSTSSTPGTS
ncbi:hypothetical protein [Tritonibacter mobilis]|uniref:hypothetical protein n=1 Tax=Tritonibacter mobilis TaxID=379347 RepID=UPI001402F14C|nr:hypothetical protein [Tritonibacter mobilis]NHM20235.1 hypothetical protein [Tritonibacter mobilis]NHM24399.1 hypothetical protein [Tritonibacter mobilis]